MAVNIYPKIENFYELNDEKTEAGLKCYASGTLSSQSYNFISYRKLPNNTIIKVYSLEGERILYENHRNWNSRM